jgi:glutamate 5-kinase
MERANLRKVRRLVVKVGSQIISEQDGLSLGRIKSLAKQLTDLRRTGRECVVVSSGAVASGFKRLGLPERPTTLRLKQAAAAAGQVTLMMAWDKAFRAYGLRTAQILLSIEDLANRGRFLNARNTVISLLELGLIPIVNENDTVAVEELKFGDNDTLGALVASLVEADFFVTLTDIEGFYADDPRKVPDAPLLSVVPKVTPEILEKARDDSGPLGVGGMRVKVLAASRLAERGLPSVIASGLTRDILPRLLEGEDLGTFFPPTEKKRGAYKHWLAFAARPKGVIWVDEGAAFAVKERGKSLLPSGVAGVEGVFAAGDPVSIAETGFTPLGVGLSNYASSEIERIKGLSSNQIVKALGYVHSEEIVHRDNLVVISGSDGVFFKEDIKA